MKQGRNRNLGFQIQKRLEKGAIITKLSEESSATNALLVPLENGLADLAPEFRLPKGTRGGEELMSSTNYDGKAPLSDVLIESIAHLII
jgi:hypothetical protein